MTKRKKVIKPIKAYAVIKKGNKTPYGNSIGVMNLYKFNRKPEVNSDYEVIPVLISPLLK